jgi:predicted AAA+ superfamily ATPase
MINFELIEINRKNFLNKLISFKDKQLIKVISGVRRCGKSTLMQQFIKYLFTLGINEEQIIFINFEDFENRDLLNLDNFYKYVSSKIIKDKKMYLFFDEIQQVKDFQKVVDSFYIKKNIDIYLTGSNSTLLSGELATLLTGRYVEIKMLPLSFKEFSSVMKEENIQKTYKEYVETSSFPYVFSLWDSKQNITEYLGGLFNSIVLKDIVKRKNISDIKMFCSVCEFIFDNIGLEVSSKKIADTMTSNGRKIDSRTIENYLTGLAESFVVHKVSRFNIKGKEYLKSLEKYYVCDIGLRKALLGKKSMDVGHILENVVYLELIRRGYNVYIGKINSLEVDFVAMNQNITMYIQVAASVRDESTLQRELAPLTQIRDSYQKLILTLDEDPDADYNGILRTNVLEWLLNN